MTDLQERFRSLDRVPAPDLWAEVRDRAATAPASRGWGRPSTSLFAPVALIGTVVILILIGVGLFVRPPSVGPQPPGPGASASAVNPPSSGVRGAIAYVAESGMSSLHLLLPGDEPMQLAPGSAAGNEVACPTFSPDANNLAFGMPGGSIIVVPIDDQGRTGDAIRLNSLAGERPHCAAWSPDSSAVAFLDGTALFIVPVEGEPQRIDEWDIEVVGGNSFAGDYPPDRAVQWSPDGSVIAVARPSGTWLIPVDGSTPRRLHETPSFSVSWSPAGTRLVVGAGGPQAVVIRIADGATLAEMPMGFSPPVWSPVDDRVAFSDANAALVLVRPDGTGRVVIDDYGYNPTWSADGRQLLYIQDAASAAWRLLMTDAAGSAEPAILIDSVSISSARSFPAAEQISWQPVER